ncbi:hypothetical protein CC78DRAFT_265621 [Lojkania enalia]|uniref:Uncharacterized protein n=1 Tax=Lojkania enalia TaxID=147567 RepID=A0A9P4K6H2_9PLEO|nr:hypothetical protein CC78DRAFT_265621 [Didymosphaeria enalia]
MGGLGEASVGVGAASGGRGGEGDSGWGGGSDRQDGAAFETGTLGLGTGWRTWRQPGALTLISANYLGCRRSAGVRATGTA